MKKKILLTLLTAAITTALAGCAESGWVGVLVTIR